MGKMLLSGHWVPLMMGIKPLVALLRRQCNVRRLVRPLHVDLLFAHAATAHRRALGFEPNLWGLSFSKAIQSFSQFIFVMLSAGLIGLTKTTKAASTVMSQTLQIDHSHI